ncbi:hypothetical protein RDI58_002666 [Solanum bulbocastanum]|uniref:Leucine-rich repeat-containing N-terminal plant-type domain-containing protein n=1 Tax=Solanum bulbocastanum TaxID=147425 RepID=A0AAN8UG82_SOLBU
MERIVLSLIVVLFLMVSFSFGNPFCSSHDSLALLQFKHSLNVTDGCDNNEDCPYPKTTSWNSTSMGMDCCRWDGITCDMFTGMSLVWTSVVADLKELFIPIVAFSSFIIFKHLICLVINYLVPYLNRLDIFST